jgi:hypothetical protein
MIILMVIIMMVMVMIYYFDGYDVDGACYDVDGDGYYVVDAAVYYDGYYYDGAACYDYVDGNGSGNGYDLIF